MDNKKYTFTKDNDFLQQEEFIRWQLFQTPESEDYWRNFRLNNPHLEKTIQEAITQFDTIKINQYLIPGEEKKEIYTTVLHKVNRYKKRRLLLRVSSVAAILLAIVMSTLYITVLRENSGLHMENKSEMIVGHTLPDEEIHLISSGQKINIAHQSRIGLTADGKILITDSTDAKKELLLTQTALNTLVVPYGKRTSLILSDGTKVWLNSGSILEFPAQFVGNNREIRLASGEMYIEVSPDKQKPFHVRTPDFNVKVYGTKFNVSAYANELPSVVLVEGSVSLQSESKKEIFILPNQQAIYTENGTFNTQKVNANQFIGWKNDYLILDDTPISKVLKKIERYYNLSFNYDKDVNLQDHTCVGKIYLSENLDNVMTTLALLSRTKYTRENNRIYIIHNSQ